MSAADRGQKRINAGGGGADDYLEDPRIAAMLENVA